MTTRRDTHLSFPAFSRIPTVCGLATGIVAGLVLGLASGCGGGTPPVEGPAPTLVTASNNDDGQVTIGHVISAEEGYFPPNEKGDFMRKVCPKADCRITREDKVGLDGQKKLMLVRVSFTKADVKKGDCDPREFWLVTHDTLKFQNPRRVLSVPCDATGRDVKDEQSFMEEGEFVFSREGGGAVRWRTRTAHKLGPVAMRSEVRSSWSTTAPNFEITAFDYSTFDGSVAWYSPHCGKADKATTKTSYETLGVRKPRYEYVPIPIVDLDETYRTSKWKQVHLGNCSAFVSPTGDDGYLLKGKASNQDDAEVRVVAASETELYVDIKDDKWVNATAPAKGKARKGTSASASATPRSDSLEVWLGGELPSFQRSCLKALPPLVSFLVNVTDGKVSKGKGDLDLSRISVERHAQTFGDEFGWVHVKIKLGMAPGSIALVYHDVDKGKAKVHSLATSKLVAGEPASLGEFFAVPTERATCSVVDGKLEPQLVIIEDKSANAQTSSSSP